MDVITPQLPVSLRLVEYPLNNIEFSPEGPSDTWCGVETRRCRQCTSSVEDDYGAEYVADTWKWCGTRTMSMRLAVRLQRLAVLTNNKSMNYFCHLSNYCVLFDYFRFR